MVIPRRALHYLYRFVMADLISYDDGINEVIASDDGTITVKKYGEVRGVLHAIDIQDVRDLLDEDPHAEHRDSELAEQRIKGDE